jgi:hypothetical protein
MVRCGGKPKAHHDPSKAAKLAFGKASAEIIGTTRLFFGQVSGGAVNLQALGKLTTRQ